MEYKEFVSLYEKGKASILWEDAYSRVLIKYLPPLYRISLKFWFTRVFFRKASENFLFTLALKDEMFYSKVLTHFVK